MEDWKQNQTCCMSLPGYVAKLLLQLVLKNSSVIIFLSFFTWSVSRPSPTFSAEIVCRIFPDFTPEQTNFCMKHPRVASAIAEGIEDGLHECEKQFKHHRWNCTSTYRETASFGQNRAVRKLNFTYNNCVLVLLASAWDDFITFTRSVVILS